MSRFLQSTATDLTLFKKLRTLSEKHFQEARHQNSGKRRPMPAIKISEEVIKPSESSSRGGRRAEQPSLPRAQGEVILIADDEPSVLETVKIILNLQGYRVITANDGAEAVTAYSRSKDMVNAVLLDMVMPVMDGYITIKALREINPNVKIIAMSGFARRDSDEKSVRDAQAFLKKPYKADELLKTLQKVLDA